MQTSVVRLIMMKCKTKYMYDYKRGYGYYGEKNETKNEKK